MISLEQYRAAIGCFCSRFHTNKVQGSINVLNRIIAAFVNWTSGSVNTFLNVLVMAIMHWKLCSDFLCTCKACATFVLDMLVLWFKIVIIAVR